MKLYVFDNKNLQFKQITLRQYILGFLITGLIFSSLGFTGAIKFNTLIEKIPVIIRLNEEEFNEENLIKEIQKLNIKFGNIVYSQCIVEGASKTGERWKNPIFINGNNFLGLKKAYSRPSTAIAWGNDDYCIYNNWRDCLIDYSLYQAQNCRNIHNEKEYLIFLKEMGYSVNLNYISLLNKVNENK